MDFVQIKLKVITDNSGDSYHIPALLTSNGIYIPLVDYLLKNYHVRSRSWCFKAVFSIRIFMQYVSANLDCFENSHVLLQNFSQRLRSGTISEDGEDPSNLFWLPRRTINVNVILSHISNFSDWLADSQGINAINPRTDKLDTLERRIAFAAWYNKNQSQFLGHLKTEGIATLKQRKLIQHRQLVKANNNAISFDETLFQKFFRDGMGNRNDTRVAIRDCLIILLMHGAGVRISEAMNLWLTDVYQDPKDENSVLIKLYHPELGRAPNGWKSPNGDTHRAAYLKYKYNLTPRNRQYGSAFLGWKGVTVENKDNYIQLHWHPSFYGHLFKKLWMMYLKHLLITPRNHPYAFVSFSKSSLGEPYTINAFNDNYRAAIKRIGLEPSKQDGLSPHAHRHAYARRLADKNIEPIFIKSALHHSDISSQIVYTSPGEQQISDLLSEASKNLDQENKDHGVNDSWKSILDSGLFDD